MQAESERCSEDQAERDEANDYVRAKHRAVRRNVRQFQAQQRMHRLEAGGQVARGDGGTIPARDPRPGAPPRPAPASTDWPAH